MTEEEKRLQDAAASDDNTQEAATASEDNMQGVASATLADDGAADDTALSGGATSPQEDVSWESLLDSALQKESEARDKQREDLRQLSDLTEQGISAYQAYAERLKPKDRTDEMRRTRNRALAQALGESLGAIFSGLIASGKIGNIGYGRVVLPENQSSKTFEQVRKLRDLGDAEQQEYGRFMAATAESAARKRADLAKMKMQMSNDDARRAAAEAQHIRDGYMRAKQEEQKQQARADLEAQRAQDRIALEIKRKDLRKEIERLKANLKGSGGGRGSSDLNISDADAYYVYLVTPQTSSKTSARVDKHGTGITTTTTQDTKMTKDVLQKGLILVNRLKAISEKYGYDWQGADSDEFENVLRKIGSGKMTITDVENYYKAYRK